MLILNKKFIINSKINNFKYIIIPINNENAKVIKDITKFNIFAETPFKVKYIGLHVYILIFFGDFILKIHVIVKLFHSLGIKGHLFFLFINYIFYNINNALLD